MFSSLGVDYFELLISWFFQFRSTPDKTLMSRSRRLPFPNASTLWAPLITNGRTTALETRNVKLLPPEPFPFPPIPLFSAAALPCFQVCLQGSLQPRSMTGVRRQFNRMPLSINGFCDFSQLK